MNLYVHNTPEMSENVVYTLLQSQTAKVLAGPVCGLEADGTYM